jgi:hypothetical protein
MIEFFEQPSVFGPIFIVVATAIGALVKKFYFDVQSRLRVEVRAWNYKLSEASKKIAREEFDAKRDYFSPMRTLIDAGGYMMVTITNSSKKKISGVSIMVPDSNMTMSLQIDDAGEIIEVKKGQLIGVGDIQPKHSRVMHIWCNVDVSEFHFSVLKHLLRISADELDSVRLRFPMPRYQWKKYEFRLIWISNVLIYAAAFTALYFGYIHK